MAKISPLLRAKLKFAMQIYSEEHLVSLKVKPHADSFFQGAQFGLEKLIEIAHRVEVVDPTKTPRNPHEN